MGKFINPFTDLGFKKLFGTEVNKELLIEFAKESGEDYKEHKKGFFGKVKDAFN